MLAVPPAGSVEIFAPHTSGIIPTLHWWRYHKALLDDIEGDSEVTVFSWSGILWIVLGFGGHGKKWSVEMLWDVSHKLALTWLIVDETLILLSCTFVVALTIIGITRGISWECLKYLAMGFFDVSGSLLIS